MTDKINVIPNKPAREVDVLVIGGGPAGIAAAIASARNNASTLLVERYGFLGGELATGLPMLTFHAHSGRQVIKGIAQELVDRLIEEDGSCGHLRAPGTHVYTWTPSYPETFKYVAQEMVLESGAEILFHTFITDVVKDGNNLKGVLTASKSGQQLILAKNIIDTTGDGDIAAMGGAPYEKGRDEDGKMQPVTLMFSLGNVDVDTAARSIRPREDCEELLRIGRSRGNWIRILGSFAPWQDEIEKIGLFTDINHGMAMFSLREGEVTLNTAKVLNIDATSAEDLTRAEIEGRRQVVTIAKFMKKHIPGFENSFLRETAAHIGVRETRRIMGEYILTEEDILTGKRFDDSITCSAYTIDIHNPNGDLGVIKHLEKDAEYYHIPYRCLVPQKVDRLLVAGRCISCTHTALGSVRVTIVCMATGQAAGTAAAISVADNVSMRNIDIAKLKSVLSEQGAVV